MEKKSKGHGEKMSRKKDIFITNLLKEPTVKEAAKKSGISEATAYRWFKDYEFIDSYKEVRRQLVSRAFDKLQAESSDAVFTICQIMRDHRTPAGVRLAAARTILDGSRKTIELEELVDRMESLENLLLDYFRLELKC